jgi:hypothetical protein
LGFKKINKIDKPLAKLTKSKMEKTQINKIRYEKGNYHKKITSEIQRITREYFFKNSYANKLKNLVVNEFLDMYDLPKMNLKEINHTDLTPVFLKIFHEKKERNTTKVIL